MLFYNQFNSPLGKITLIGDNIGLTNIRIKSKILFLHTLKLSDAELITTAKQQILEYLQGNREKFDLPLHILGTNFQKKVWQETAKIPFGKTLTYGQIAQNIQNPKAARAVGFALKLNPLPLIIPCHRVIGANSKLTGFSLGVKVKKKLLQLESSSSKQNHKSAPILSK